MVGVCWIALAGCGDDDVRDRDEGVVADGGGASSVPDGAVGAADAGGRTGADAGGAGADASAALAVACERLAARQVSTCGERDGNTTSGGSTSFDITGTVDEISSEPFTCLGAWGPSDQGLDAVAWQFRVSDGVDSYSVGLSLPSGLLEVGDRVRVQYEGALLVESSYARLVVRRSDRTLLIWIEKGALTPPPEVTVASAGEPCSFEDTCGRVERDGLRVAIGGEEVVLGYGETTMLDGYAVWHGGNDRLSQPKCPGVPSTSATIAVFAVETAGDDAGAP